MIFEFTAAIDPDVYSLFNFVPTKALPLLVWLVASSILLVGVFDPTPRLAFIRSRSVVLLTSITCLCASFLVTYGISDEVAVNLEHAYNLYNHGLFSMSPNEIVDGTVEIPFYLLHTPFGASAQSLVIGNFLICLAVFLTLVALMVGPREFSVCTAISVLVISSWEPIVNVFSSGFGNGLPAVLFLCGLLCIIRRMTWPIILIVFILPFTRPDAILIGGVLMVVFFIDRWKFGGYTWAPFVLGLMLSVTGVLGFFLLFNSYYGDFTPTPIRFKSITPGMLEFFSPSTFLHQILELFESPHRVLAIVTFIVIVTMWILAVLQRRESVVDSSNRVSFLLAMCVAFSTPIFLFFTFSNSIVPDFSGTTERYWVIWDISLLLFFLKAVSQPTLHFPKLFFRDGVMFDRLVAPVIVLLGLGALMGDTWFDNRERLGLAGGIAEEFFPDSLTLATAEMNTFGLMIDKPVQDYWGYSNDVIAASKVCNGGVNRIVPDLFLEQFEDIFYMFFIGERSNVIVDSFYGTEQVMAGSVNNFARNSGYRLGDINEVMKQYDVLILKVPGDSIGFLVKKDKKDILFDHLVGNGFELSRKRMFDQKIFTTSYFSKPLVLRDCG